MPRGVNGRRAGQSAVASWKETGRSDCAVAANGGGDHGATVMIRGLDETRTGDPQF